MDSKATTVLTNLQRGNIEAKVSAKIDLNFFEKCAQGEINDDDIRCRDNIDQTDSEGFTALHWASYYGQQKTCMILLEFGAELNKLAENYISPLHLAANGHHEIVRLLLLKGAKISQMDICGNTALHYAAAKNFPHCTSELINNPSVDIMLENEDGKTAYHLAVENKAQLSQAVIESFISNVIS